VVVDVAATAVNRADLLQRQGFYPPPPGASEVLGLECSGVVSEVGEGVTGWSVGDEVCALLAGGGYAERVAVPAGQLLPRPAGVELATASALPEVTCTVWSNVFMLAGLRRGDSILVHGGSSGIGTMAIQLAVRAGARVFTTAGTEAKLDFCRELGADVLINYREENFEERVAEETDGAGVDVVLDNMGAKYLGPNVRSLAVGGRLVSIGMQGGTKGELDLGLLMRKRAAVHATTLRSRPPTGPGGKAEIVAAVRHDVWPDVERGVIRPIIDRRLPMSRAAEAHRVVESSEHIGKVLLVPEE
jgi:putative PIG3 family NAD(P)H quinone oxidoreductase